MRILLNLHSYTLLLVKMLFHLDGWHIYDLYFDVFLLSMVLLVYLVHIFLPSFDLFHILMFVSFHYTHHLQISHSSTTLFFYICTFAHIHYTHMVLLLICSKYLPHSIPFFYCNQTFCIHIYFYISYSNC